MRKNVVSADHVVVLLTSFFVIILELFLTRILNLKAWNHVVYTVIPFAILGYGIGANAYLILRNPIDRLPSRWVVGCSLLAVSGAILITYLSLAFLPLRVEYVVNIFKDFRAVSMLALAYTLFMLPFISIGFLIVYVFSVNPKESPRLYFYDLLGAGIGAAAFFPLMNYFAVFHSLLLLFLTSLGLALFILLPRHKIRTAGALLVLFFVSVAMVPELKNYAIDPAKGWEWIPGHFPKENYRQVTSRWHPLGRTDIYRITDEPTRNDVYSRSPGTFLINVEPRPEFAYISTNFLAGTPVYHLSEEGMRAAGSKLQLFSQSMEAPYLFLDKPRVLVIGAGGGRDLYMAKSHGAREVLAAEINPGIVREMSPGGTLHEYSGGVYTLENTKVHAVDGRTLVKRAKTGSVDLIVLNGVDTFSGLSSGAYAYAESYLYTKDALVDYLRVLTDGGIVNFNRWLFPSMPRESLRLHAIALEALRTIGAAEPWNHIIIGDGGGWSFILIKKTPFTQSDREKVFQYFRAHHTVPLFPKGDWAGIVGHPLNYFDYYTEDFRKGVESAWLQNYPFDISVVTDDDPFFYKYYRLSSFNPFKAVAVHHTGTVIFLTQTLVLAQAVIFIVLFIFLPLFVFKKRNVKRLPPRASAAFILFFGCLGCGYMFIEIPLMQRFVLLLGSPIYSITVVLAVLLISTGLGSLMLERFQRSCVSLKGLLTAAAFFITAYIFGLVFMGTHIFDHVVGYSFFMRVMMVSLILFPLGLVSGFFFPSGLATIGRFYPESIPWAWAVNGGFSVLGSILSIMIAQFSGFNTILIMAATIYLAGILAYQRMEAVCLKEGSAEK